MSPNAFQPSFSASPLHHHVPQPRWTRMVLSDAELVRQPGAYESSNCFYRAQKVHPSIQFALWRPFFVIFSMIHASELHKNLTVFSKKTLRMLQRAAFSRKVARYRRVAPSKASSKATQMLADPNIHKILYLHSLKDVERRDGNDRMTPAVPRPFRRVSHIERYIFDYREE